MPRIVKNTLLNYISDNFVTESDVNPKRVFEINKKPIKKGFTVYLCEREIRAKDNFALQFAIQKSKKLDLPLRIIHPKINYDCESKQKFIDSQIFQAKNHFKKSGLNFQIISQNPENILDKIKIGLLVVDFNPILKRQYLKKADYKIYEIDGHNIIPARYVSHKQEYSAATFRKHVYDSIYPFLTEFKNITKEKTEADYVLEDFIKNKLPYYAEYRNNPSKDVLSGLSKYLNLGFISSQRTALEVIKSNTSSKSKEIFLEELIIRKELTDNFCLYAKNFKDFSSIPSWASASLESHKYDIRPYIYSIKEFESGKTHDKLWNAAQHQLTEEGKIHGYLRMYWAKKILEWTRSPVEALKIAIYLNDKYAYDAPSSNGYVGILWAIGGLHDRAFIDYPVTGKIRRMTHNSIKGKFNLCNYSEMFCL